MCRVFRYLEKVFHTVDHQILSQKLYHYGILGLAHIAYLNRIYLTNNNFFLQVFSSEMVSVKCPVSQGSTLGVFLFLLYINDLNSLFNKAITRQSFIY